MIIFKTGNISLRNRIKLKLVFLKLRAMLRPVLIISNPGYEGLSEREKQLAEEWASGLREGVAKALGIPVEMIREIPESWKYAWVTKWEEAFIGPPKEKGIEMAEKVA